MSKVAARILQAIDQSVRSCPSLCSADRVPSRRQYIIPAAQRTPDLQRQFQLVANSLSERERDAQDLVTYLEAAKLHKARFGPFGSGRKLTIWAGAGPTLQPYVHDDGRGTDKGDCPGRGARRAVGLRAAQSVIFAHSSAPRIGI
jgi:hypothetical protein